MATNNRTFSWKSFLALTGAGLLGVLSLIPFARKQVQKALEQTAEPPKLSPPLMVLIALAQTTVMLALAVYGGLRLAPRLGLRSRIVERIEQDEPLGPGLRRDAGPALVGALLTTAAIWFGERFFSRWTGEQLEQLQAEQPRDLGVTVMGVLYGGIVEELLMRWGLVSLFARLLQRLRGLAEPVPPSSGVMSAAIGLAAFLFGAGHLPALAAMATLTPALVARTILLNAAGGLFFGALYWKRSLEAAMMAHGGSHILLSLLQLVAGERQSQPEATVAATGG